MRKLFHSAIGVIAIAAGCLMTQSAHAETITAQLTGLDPYVFGTVSLQGSTEDGGIGNILWQGVSANAAPFNGAFNTYCIDLIQDIGFGSSYTFTIVSLQDAPKAGAFPSGTPTTGMGTVKANEIDELFGQNYTSTLGSTAQAATDREAFQLAIWNIIYDTDASVSTGQGTFYATGDVDPNAIAAANTFLAEALNTDDQAIYHADDIVGLIGANGAQDQLAINPFTTTSDAPLPAPLIGGSLLLTLAALFRQRRLQALRQTI